MHPDTHLLPDSFQFSSPWPRRWGHLVMACLLIMSICLYKERTLILDIAYQTFLMLVEGHPQVMVNRFGVVLIQSLPLLGMALHLSLKVILILYSAAFPLLFWLFYWLITKVLRNDYLGWALVFLYTLIVFDAFYWATSEQQQALGLLLVVFAFVLRYPALDRWWMLGVGILAVPALAYYHPLIFIPFFFLWGYGYLCFPALRHRRFLGLGVWMVLVLIIKSKFSGNWYDNQKYSDFFNNLKRYFPNYWDLPSNGKFLEGCLQYWYFLPILALAVSIYYFRQKYWWRWALAVAFCFGHLFLLHIGSPNTTYRFYAEVNYMPLVIYFAVPFMLEVLPSLRGKTWWRLLPIIAVFRLVVIWQHHQPFTERWQWLATQMETWKQQYGGQRFYLPLDQAPQDTLLMTWGTPYETLLLTALKHPDSAATLLILPEPGTHQPAMDSDDFFATEFKDWPLATIRSPYFTLKPGKYQQVSRAAR